LKYAKPFFSFEKLFKVVTGHIRQIQIFSFNFRMASDTPSSQDPFKDSIWRFLGYANEVGEALRPMVPVSAVWSTYAIAIGYALADTYHKGNREYQETKNWAKTADKATETAIWQTLASVTVPPLFINRVVKFTDATLSSPRFSLPPSRAKAFATLAGLATIPIIFKPIDYATDLFIEHVYHGLRPNSLKATPGKQEEL
jgi:fission process protein 1